MSSPCRWTALVCLLTLAVAAGAVDAQALYGSVTGTILDSSRSRSSIAAPAPYFQCSVQLVAES